MSPVYLPSTSSSRLGDHDVRAEQRADRLDDLGAARGDDHDVAAGELVLLDQADGLVVDQRVDDVVQRVGDDLADRGDVPTGDERGHERAHLLHLVVVGAAEDVDELGVRRAQHGAPGDEAAGLERLAERHACSTWR